MTKKIKIYALVVLVLVIWGVIGFQIYNGLFSENREKSLPISSSTFSYDTSRKKSEIYTVDGDYRDPFFGNVIYPRKQKTKRTNYSKPIRKEEFPVKKIVFNGVIKRGNKKVYILTIDHKQELLQVGSTVNTVTLLRGFDDKIVVRTKGGQQTIKIK